MFDMHFFFSSRRRHTRCALVTGVQTCALPIFDPGRVLAAIEQHRINCILMVPTMISAVLDHPRLKEFDLSSLETIFYGASPITPTRPRQGIAQFGPIFFQFYGQAEAMPTVTVMRRDEPALSSDERWEARRVGNEWGCRRSSRGCDEH